MKMRLKRGQTWKWGIERERERERRRMWSGKNENGGRVYKGIKGKRDIDGYNTQLRQMLLTWVCFFCFCFLIRKVGSFCLFIG
jgi:hypothetical protein